jgi:hypothetical protein
MIYFVKTQLGKALRDFQIVVSQYIDDPTPLNEATLKFEVNNESEFTAFKRWRVKLAPQNYPAQLASWFIN